MHFCLFAFAGFRFKLIIGAHFHTYLNIIITVNFEKYRFKSFKFIQAFCLVLLCMTLSYDIVSHRAMHYDKNLTMNQL